MSWLFSSMTAENDYSKMVSDVRNLLSLKKLTNPNHMREIPVYKKI